MEVIRRQDSSTAAGVDLQRLAALVEELQKITQDFLRESGGIQALEKNARRILANVRMLQLDLGLDPDPPALFMSGDQCGQSS